MNCLIHPNITPNILDHYMRKPEGQQVVVGTLLGTLEGSLIEI